MTSYPFRQGIDYGPRKGTLGLALHMSEGGDGLVSYLSRAAGETVTQWKTRVRGVSANACILSDGTVWQMVDWSNASGSMNPADRNPATTGYYNGTIIRAVLGDAYTDPNAWSISCEIAGRRADGPTQKQVAAAIAWGKDMAAMFPTLRGAYGHADQTDTKGCPGTTPNMRAIFDGLGGHGLWNGDTMSIYTRNNQPGRFTIPAGKSVRGWQAAGDGWTVAKTWIANSSPSSGPYDYHLVRVSGTASPSSLLHVPDGFFAGLFISTADVEETATPPPATDCTQAVKDAKAAQHELTRAAAIKAVEAI